jgi:small subunit ribosomal protein S17
MTTATTVHHRKLEGIVTSDRMQKTCVVAVARMKKHPKYLKYYKVTTKFKVHDEKNEAKTGDRVIIEETRPISKDKRFTLVSVIEKSARTGNVEASKDKNETPS